MGAQPARIDPPPDELFEPAATVTVYPDGPLIVRGDVEIRDLSGNTLATGPVALCRCGRSALKPLCDGSHKNRRARGAASTRAAVAERAAQRSSSVKFPAGGDPADVPAADG